MTGAEMERPLPQNVDAERSVLGAILLDNHSLNAALEVLRPEDFFLDQHRRLYLRMIALGEQQRPIDLVTMAEELRRSGEFEAAGGPAYLAQLVDGVPRITHVDHYARIVKEKSMLRWLIHAAEAVQQQALDAEDEPSAIAFRANSMFSVVAEAAPGAPSSVFHAAQDFDRAPAVRFAIDGLLQIEGATMIGGLSGHGKTLFMLSLAKALLGESGRKLWGHFRVAEPAERVIYLIPESALSPFAHRARLFGLLPYVAAGRLLVRTLSKGPTLPLSDPRILCAAAGGHVFLDTAIRFANGDENAAGDNQRGLANDIFGLLGAGASSVVAAHHSPKGFETQTVMTLENMLRGSGDIGAMLSAAWGLRQIDRARNIIHVENLKARDFEPCGPFELVGRPNINEDGDFGLLKPPGGCGRLAETLPAGRDKGGARPEIREARAARLELIRELKQRDPDLTSQLIAQELTRRGIPAKDSTVRHDLKEIGL